MWNSVVTVNDQWTKIADGRAQIPSLLHRIKKERCSRRSKVTYTYIPTALPSQLNYARTIIAAQRIPDALLTNLSLATRISAKQWKRALSRQKPN